MKCPSQFAYDTDLNSRCDEIITALKSANVPNSLFTKIQRLTQYALKAKKYIAELVQEADTRYFEHAFRITRTLRLEIHEFKPTGLVYSTEHDDKELAEALVLDLIVLLKPLNIRRSALPPMENVNKLMKIRQTITPPPV